MSKPLDGPVVERVAIDVDPKSVPDATLEDLLSVSELEYDAEAQLVRLPAAETDSDEAVYHLPGEVAELLGGDD